MRNKTVKRRIFISNALMILVTLFLVVSINFVVIKVYGELIEKEFLAVIDMLKTTGDIKTVIEEWTIHKKSFLALFVIDGIICVIIWMVVSAIFTGNLVKNIMEPLRQLDKGILRIKNNKIDEPVIYSGEVEFENVCKGFNELQVHLLMEKNKNLKYEKARTEMIAGISHDLRTPLTAIKGSIKAILDGVVNEEEQKKQFLIAACNRTNEMDKMLSQLIYISKLETGNMLFDIKRINFKEFISSYIENMWEYCSREEIEIEINWDVEYQYVKIDTMQFRRILDNLLENSKKYAVKRPVKIKISAFEKDESVIICFEDNGTGVEEDNLETIFEQFYREDESRNKQKGNGLGLHIVKCLIEAMDGKVWAENREGLAVFMELKKG